MNSLNYYGKRLKHQYTICVEGNIGSGKSTLLHYLGHVMDVNVTAESVDKWKNFKGTNLLEMMYTDAPRWAYLFQSYVQLTMLNNHMVPSSSPIKLMERSLHSARFCFVENMYRSGIMSEMEYLVYCRWYCAFTSLVDCTVDLIVYLRTDPLIVHERIAKRARVEERTVSLEYCQDLHQIYEEWIKGPNVPSPVLVIDANEDLSKMNVKYEYVMETILKRKLAHKTH